jgi:hypothetical protein
MLKQLPTYIEVDLLLDEALGARCCLQNAVNLNLQPLWLNGCHVMRHLNVAAQNQVTNVI